METKTKLIEFTASPTGRYGLAYFKGDKADLPVNQANELIEAGYAKPFKSDKGDESDLPPDLPGRKVLVAHGVKYAELKAINDYTVYPGVTPAMAAKIKTYLAGR